MKTLEHWPRGAPLLLASALVVGAGCNRSTPVSSSALRGTIDGKPFIAESAFRRGEAGPGLKGLYEFAIFDQQLTRAEWCGRAPELGANHPYIHGFVPWKTGFTQVGTGLARGFMISGKFGSTAEMAAEAMKRIEVFSASPTEGVVRIRLAGENGAVEGEITMQVCP